MIELTHGQLDEIAACAEGFARIERPEPGWSEAWSDLARAALRCAALVEQVVFPEAR